jgi:hypothetical protein
MLMPAHNLPQTTPDTIANDCTSEATRSDEASTTQARIFDRRHTKGEQLAAPDEALSFHAFIFRCARQTAISWEGQ